MPKGLLSLFVFRHAKNTFTHTSRKPSNKGKQVFFHTVSGGFEKTVRDVSKLKVFLSEFRFTFLAGVL